MSGRYVRAFWLWLHRWLGFALGLPLLVVGLSGSILVFYPTLDRLLDSRIATVTGCEILPPERILEGLQQQLPERIGSWRLEMPMEPGLPYNARFMNPIETRGAGFAPLLVWIQPCSGDVLRQGFWGQTLMTWIYNLHYQLLLGATGSSLVAWGGLVTLLLTLVGLWLWWPKAWWRGASWRKALQWRQAAHPAVSSWQRHVLVGFYSLPLWLLLVITGVLLDAPGWYNSLANRLSPLPPYVMYHSVLDGSQPAMSVTPVTTTDAIRIARQQFPQAELRWLETPADMLGVYQMRLYQDGEPGRRFPQTRLVIDQYSGKVLMRHDPFEDNAGATVQRWLHPLHSGEAFGLIGRWLVLLCGLLPVWMLWTGTQRWYIKRQARQRRGLQAQSAERH